MRSTVKNRVCQEPGRGLDTRWFRRWRWSPSVPWSNLSPAVVESPVHRALARDAAARGIVLLKNSADILPFSPTVKRLAVVEPTASDARVLLARITENRLI